MLTIGVKHLLSRSVTPPLPLARSAALLFSGCHPAKPASTLISGLNSRVHRRRHLMATAGPEFELVDIENPKELNFILGQAHFIKTVEDLYEACFQASPGLKFGLAFCEASGDRKLRCDGNSEELVELAKKNALKVGAGHSFLIFIDQGYPVNILGHIKNCPTVCRVYCATANPTAVLVAKRGEQRGIAGVLDGFAPVGVEDGNDVEARLNLLKAIGYKR